ncbi:TPA: hypothetical protein PX802_002466 [Vibrio cholerae]|nr:hypothetical protein [Vibrio cholerae]
MKVKRKVRTLIKNPVGVFNKYILQKRKSVNENVDVISNVVIINKEESNRRKVVEHSSPGRLNSPRVSHVLYDNEGQLKVLRYEKLSKNPSFVSLLFVENKKYLTECEISSKINKAIKYVSFREKTLFFCDVNLGRNYDMSIVFENVAWRSNPFEEIKNLIFINPSYNYYQAVCYSKPKTNSIAVFDSPFDGVDLDVFDLVLLKNDISNVNHRNVRYFNSTECIPELIGEYIGFVSPKPYDLLVPIFGVFDYMENIDELNQSNLDIIFYLRKDVRPDMCTFENLSHILAENTISILAKESVLYRYKTLVDYKNIKELFKRASFDGLKIEVVW